MRFSQRLNDDCKYSMGMFINPEKEDTVHSDEQLLDYIYAVDPVTALPSGDLSVYLGDKANPEIRQYIEMNLLQPSNVDKGSSLPTDITNKFKSVSDDDIAFFSRSKSESREEYADRIKAFFISEKQRRRQEGHLKELETILKNKDEK